MQLYFSSSVGETDSGQVGIEPDDSIGQLRERIANQLIMETDAVNLLHKGQELPQTGSVKKAGLSDGDTVKVIPNNSEGGTSSSGSLSTHTRQRLASELSKIKLEGIPLRPVKGNPLEWRGKVPGTGRWSGQKFPMKVELPSDYPTQYPNAYLLKQPRPAHPNIHPNGWVCVNHLYKSWQPHFNLAMVYEMTKWLFRNPNYNSPGHPDAIRPKGWTKPRRDQKKTVPNYIRSLMGL